MIKLPEFHLELFSAIGSEDVLEGVDLLVGHAALHAAVGDAVALGAAVRLGVRERVDELNLLYKVARDATSHLEKVVLLVPLLGQPKSDVLVAHGVLGEGLKRANLSRGELFRESFIRGPEQSNVGDLEQHHGESFEAEAERPPVPVLEPALPQHLRVHHPATKHLEPVAFVKHFQLEAGLGEREVVLVPALLHPGKQHIHHPLQRRLQVVADHFAGFGLHPVLRRDQTGQAGGVPGEQLHPLHLVEGREVRPVDLVAPVHVPSAQESFEAAPQVLGLVRARVRAEQGRVSDVVRVGRLAARVVGGDPQVVEALRGGHDGVLAVEDVELGVQRRKVVLDLLADNPDGMIWREVQVSPHEFGDVRRDVVVWVVGGVPRRRSRCCRHVNRSCSS
mmetsp:Transcript_65878/g.113257  ORF Transcript_65878/g.113257 Transcript_65878/m.113257 type:complete len:392 (+) Transcript_65878:945-2120(+)